MKLFIVESPNKCAKLRGYLGNDYKVAASVGHIRQIPKKGLNIDIKNNFTPTFEVTDDKKKVVKELKELAEKADTIILATDPDREGEAIAWHIYDLLSKKNQDKCVRVTFNEITQKAVLDAVKKPRKIDFNLVDAQKARQILDRLIGYKVSPVLWHKAHIAGSSAGRVQSIALKIICERQKEIDAFKPIDFWFIEALLQAKKGEFWAKVVTKNKDNRYLEEKLAKDDFEKLKTATYKVDEIEKKEKKIEPNPPFDTNSLQTTCSSLFGWSLSKSKTLAQKLYEQGLVTYIRTDSYSIANEAIDEVRELIKTASSPEYLPAKANAYKKKSSASSQEAHECIRPTHVKNQGEDIEDEGEKKMYKLIRDRFIACQMTPMIVDTVAYTIKTDTKHTLIARGQTIKFDGWFKAYKYNNTKEEVLPEVESKEELKLKDIKNTKHQTQPPARYNEGSLAKKMETEGVGRPSTRDSIITSIQKKAYVDKEKGGKGLVATPLGMSICDYLNPHFKDFFMDIKYTSELENSLDEIASGGKSFLEVVQSVYNSLKDHIKDADADETSAHKLTGKKCTVCDQGEIVEKRGRFGAFFACSKYPDCKTVYEKKEDGEFIVKKGSAKGKSTGNKCTSCKDGEIVEKKGKFGMFFACSNYPACKTIYQSNEDGKFSIKQKGAGSSKKIGRKCPDCDKNGREGDLVERKNKEGSAFIGCSLYPRCRYSEKIEEK